MLLLCIPVIWTYGSDSAPKTDRRFSWERESIR